MFKSQYLGLVSKVLIPMYAATAFSVATPSTSFAQGKKKETISSMVVKYKATSDPVDRMLDSLVLNYWGELPKNQQNAQDWVNGYYGADPKFEAALAIERYIEVNQKKGKKVSPKQRWDVMSVFGGSKYFKPGQQAPQKQPTYVTPVPDQKKLEQGLQKALEFSGKDTIYTKIQPREGKPVRIVRRPTKLKLIKGELPQGTSIATTSDNSDFLKTPVRTPFYRFNSAWGLIEGLELAKGRLDISDLLASALPEVRKYMSDPALNISEKTMRRWEIDDIKVVNGKTIKGKDGDGLPLDHILPTDDLFWSARVLAKRDYRYLTPEVTQKALEKIVIKPDTVYIKVQPEIVAPREPEAPAPQPITQITKVEQKKSDKTLYCILGGLAVGGILYAILKGKEEEKPQPQPTGGFKDSPLEPGVHTPIFRF